MRRPRFAALGFALALAAGSTACVAGAGAGAAGQTMVTVNNSRFIPERFEFSRGQTVTFVIVNDDPIDHEFILGDQAVQDVHESGNHPYHDEIPTEVSLPASQTVTTTITFMESGDFIIGCHLPQHYAYGMRADLKVV